MPPSIALWLCVGFVIWLCLQDSKRRERTSGALWIPLMWALIISSRPLSLWLGVRGGPESGAGGVEDTIIDKSVFLFLITAGLIVLVRRHVDWTAIFRNNKWLFLYFIYLGASVLWSDEPFVSFKRWIKDAGNIVMILVILTEQNPFEAVRTFLARWTYVLLPSSVLIIKYYPQLSRIYDIWTNQPVSVGPSTDKNTFGMLLFVCGLSLVWLLLEDRGEKNHKRALLIYSFLLFLTILLLGNAQSATAITCLLLGSCLLVAARVPIVRSQASRFWTFVVAATVAVAILHGSGAWDAILKEFARAVGRDSTLHGRVEIWQNVLKEDINPLIGVGYYSFWSPERNQRISKGYFYLLGESHNGYIETYLNSGIIGLTLLALMILSATNRIRRDFHGGSSFAALRLAFLITIAVYNITESAFDRLVPVWFALLLVLIEYPRPLENGAEEEEFDFSLQAPNEVAVEEEVPDHLAPIR